MLELRVPISVSLCALASIRASECQMHQRQKRRVCAKPAPVDPFELSFTLMRATGQLQLRLGEVLSVGHALRRPRWVKC